jgi:trans-2,3-dihydro-3-hydroxyanthranilate isomerase
VRLPLRFHTLDVFTNRKFAGNPLAVVEDADGLTDAEMLAIAREFNLSETVFLQSPRDPVNSARARIFTPGGELPFAGHPTIGAAVLLAETRAGEVLSRHGVVIVLEEPIGVLRCEVIRARAGASFAQFAAPAPPEKLGPAPTSDVLARALSLEPQDIGFGAHSPTLYSAGLPLTFVPLRSREALDRARKAPASFPAAMGATRGAYLYTHETMDETNAIQARMFAYGLGFDEDPGTGSAAAAFAGVALEFERPEDGEHEIFIEQGHKMGRPSRITLRMDVEGGRLACVHIGGQAVRVSEGVLKP